MKILLVSQHFWPESFRINAVAAALADAGCEVTVLTGQPNYPSGVTFEGYSAAASGCETHDGYEIQRVPLVPRGGGSASRLAANYLSFIVSAASIGAWRLRQRPFDVVFVYGTSPILQAIAAVFLARLKQAALITWVQDLWPQSLEVTGYVKNRHALATVGAIVRWIYARNDMLLVQSRAFTEPVRRMSPPQVPIHYHPNPGDSDVPAEGEAAGLDLPAGFNIVFAGNLGMAQALDSVLDAAERLADLPDLRIVLVGSGQRSAWLAEQVTQRGLGNVLLPGRFPAEAMPGILAKASALLVTLVSDPTMELTVPSKVQSYLAAGRPIVGALEGEGARVITEAQAGLTCAAGDGAALADTLRSLHALPLSARDRMGAMGRRYHAEHFALATLTASLIRHLEAAAAAHALPSSDNSGFRSQDR